MKLIARHARLSPAVAGIGAFLAAALVVGFMVARAHSLRQQQEQARVALLAQQHASALEGHLIKLANCTRVVGSLLQYGDGQIEDFDTLAARVLAASPGVAALNLAPNGIVTQEFPRASAGSAVGRDLLEDPTRTPGAALARETNALTLAGPFPLLRGGVGAVARLPVTRPGPAGPQFWGFVSAVIPFPEALGPARIQELAERGYAVRLSRPNASGPGVQELVAVHAAELRAPIECAVEVPNGQWTLSIAPRAGWSDWAAVAGDAGMGLALCILVGATAGLMIQRRDRQLELEAAVARQTKVLRQREADLHRAQAIARMGSWTVEFRFGRAHELNWSAETFRIFGLSDTAVPRFKTVFRSVHPEDRAKLWSAWQALVRGAPMDLEYRLVGTRGIGLVHACGECVRDSAGEVRRCVGTIQDMTEQRRAEQRLLDSENLFARVFHGSPTMMALSDLSDGRVFEINENFTAVSGYTREEVIGRTSVEIGWVQAEDRQRLAGRLLAVGRLKEEELAFYKKDGEALQTLYSGELLEFGGRACLISTWQDVTARRQLEDQIRHAQRMEAVGELAGGVAHDFNNILAALLIYLGLLHDDPAVAPELRDKLKQIEKEIQRGVGLTRQLLRFSRRETMQVESVDLNEVLGRLTAMLQRVLGEHIEIVVDAPDRAVVEGDITMIEQSITNLCVNARDAMKDGGRLTVRTRTVTQSRPAGGQPMRWVRIEVADTGCGMDESTRRRVFDPFFTTKPPGEGTGLGLAIVHGIAQQHHGWVEVESAVGAGSSFRIFLPASDAPPPAPVSAEAPVNLAGRGERVLFAEDDAAVRSVIAMTLARHGYQVTEATNGPAALQQWREQEGAFDLLISDMIMPGGMSGLALLHAIRAERPDLPVLLCTGYSQELTEPQADPRVKVMRKPFGMTELLAAVHECLASPGPAAKESSTRAE